ncbi:hypothetical protein [Clostridium gasigenes]|uniref:Type IV pilus assembly protein PilO n=1 Tax=Clostridium gasigenes TaxID=94869 RepID=A0A1H0STD1_9CLOT|nr:hypothetical protein [Clostridium gasigenes]MBB6623418.1 hypothetical protein [Clostridium gasigenes]MBU3089689.1 hypothetical protein [Clostridium gasigenes]MBU3108500.1 hypothetical protein [Clostridium gasigenes]MBU3133631.1 hypothetical protein [Clostridium gasigenes]NKF07883.1 hypothetical protein [Clostridium gasigenes]
MKMSKKEKYLLGILGTVLISILYYQFIYINQVKKLDVKKKEKVEIETRHDEVLQSIKTLESRKENLKILNSSILEKSSDFYPTILQEKIILEIDKLLTDSGLNGNIAFSPIEVASVETMVAPEVAKAESSMKIIADEYNGSYKSEEEAKKQETPNAGKDEKSGEKVESQTGVATAEQLKVAINFTGSYDTLKKFILSVQEYKRKVVITNVAITPKSEAQVTGTMNIEFYAVPKLGDDDAAYLKWTMESVHGKDILFSTGAASGAYNSTVEEQGTKVDINDFVMMLRPTSSELPVLTIGKAKDSSRETYLYSDNAKIEDVEIEFNEENEKIYYKYKTTKDFYPKSNTSVGKEITTISKDIVMEITSEARTSTNDNSTVKLKVINNTKKNVNLIIKSDDNSNPRVSVVSEGNTVNVTKK